MQHKNDGFDAFKRDPIYLLLSLLDTRALHSTPNVLCSVLKHINLSNGRGSSPFDHRCLIVIVVSSFFDVVHYIVGLRTHTARYRRSMRFAFGHV